MCTIGQISNMFQIPVSTLRYYDKEGLFPHLEKKSGIRNFTQTEVEELRIIECLKRSGMEIKDIKQFMKWTTEGPSTYSKRRQMFEDRLRAVEAEMEQIKRTMDMLKFKCWYYDKAIQDGNEDQINRMLPDHLPEDIQKLYNSAHEISDK